MGLAATQARFLAITSRKANCEFRSMELAQQKLSLSRELEEATINYNNAIEASKIIWDVDGSGQYRYGLSYDLMMNPSDLNQYMPYLLSRQDGKISMNTAMANALNGVLQDDGGIIYGGQVIYRGAQNYDAAKQAAFNNFIDGMVANRAMPSSIADKLYANGSGGNYAFMPDAGIGGELFGRERANMMSANSMLNYIDNIIDMANNGSYPEGTKEYKLAQSLIFDFDTNEAKKATRPGYADSGDELFDDFLMQDITCKQYGVTNLSYNGSQSYDNQFSGFGTSELAFTMADLLSDNITLSAKIGLSDLDTSGASGSSERHLVEGYNTIINEILTYLRAGGKDAVMSIINDVPGKYTITTTDTSGNPVTVEESGWYDKIAEAGSEIWAYDDSNKDKPTLEWLENNARVQIWRKKDSDCPAALAIATINFIDKLAKGMWNLLMPVDDSGNIDDRDYNAFYLALESTIQSFRLRDDNCYEVDNGAGVNSDNEKQAISNANKYNCWTKYRGCVAMSLSNLTEAFLTRFVDGMDNYQNGCIITDKVSSSAYITDNQNYLFTVNTDEDIHENLWEAEFYSIIFNNLCESGWYENQMLNDSSYISNALKNGQLFVMSNGNDNHYYQTRYAQASGGHIKEERDTDAAVQAERQYTYIKNKINYKEERIEVETKSVDAELSSLNTELETVKNMIAKNIDKTFKMFQS